MSEDITHQNHRYPDLQLQPPPRQDDRHPDLQAPPPDPSEVMHRIKQSFMMNYNKRVGRRSGRVWQHRFWDHVIRDQDDLNKHTNYIHYNPVKHEQVTNPFEYELSTAKEYLADGFYGPDWGVIDRPLLEGDFGE